MRSPDVIEVDADVAVLFEFSGSVRDAFLVRGIRAVSVDVLPALSRPEHHIQTDVRNLDLRNVKLAICHPPCTYLANSGVSWLHRQPGRWDLMRQAAAMFRWCLDLPVPRLCVENPVQHRHAQLPRPTQYIQPWMFGEMESKMTGLWLRNLPPLVPDVHRKPEGVRCTIHRLPRTPYRPLLRSITFPGIAKAMASQWGSLIQNTEASRNEQS